MIKTDKTIVELINGNIIDLNSGEVLLSTDDIKSQTGKDIQFVETPDGGLALGFSIPGTVPTPVDFLKDWNEYKFTNADIYKQMDVCNKLYRYEGIVGSVVDLYVDISNTKIIAQDLANEEAIAIFNYLSDNLNSKVSMTRPGMSAFIDQGMTSWFVFGNAFPYKSWRTVTIGTKDYTVPNIIYLNPDFIVIDENGLITGNEQISLKLNSNMKAKLPGSGFKIDPKQLKSGKLPLSSGSIDHIKRKSRDWDPWGIPFIARTFSPIASKRRLRRLDDLTSEGLINYLTIFKIGSPNEKSPYHKVSLGRLQAFANLIKNPTPSTTLVWPHDLEVETAGPDGKILQFKEKYSQVDNDILISLGLGAFIFGNARIGEETILLLIETLETVRNQFLNYIKNTYMEVLQKNSIKADEFKLKFTNIKLSDLLQKLKSLLLSYYDRGLLSYETALTLGGHDYQQEIERKTNQKAIQKKGLFDIPNLPFSTQKKETPMTQRDDGRPDEKMRTEKTKIDNDVKLNKPSKNIGGNLSRGDILYISSYKEGLENKYFKTMNKIIEQIKKDGTVDENKLNLIVAAGFLEMKNYTQKALKLIYDVFNEDTDTDELDFTFQKLEGWNTFYMVKFREALLSSIKRGSELMGDVDVDLVIPAIITAFDKESYRMEMYAMEGFIKAKMAGVLETEAKMGNIGGYWVTMGDETVCDTCAGKEGNWYKNEEILDVYPSHPKCRCDINWTSSNPLIDHVDINNTPIVVSPDKPNKPL